MRPMRGTAWFSALRIGGRSFSLVRLFLVVALVVAAYPLQAMRDKNGDEVQSFDFDEKYIDKWKETKVEIPAYPNDRDLLQVPLSVSERLKIYIDLKSVSLAPDRVSRFSYVVESPSGARSVFYDGFRCETRQYKTYAIGSSIHSFEPVVKPQWRTIPRPEINAFRYQLYRNYVCDDHASARTPEDLARQLKYQP
jgi:hypothetical protein